VPISRVSMPACPECGASESSIIYEHLGIKTLSCGDCGHSWRIERPVRANLLKKKGPAQTKRPARRM